MRQVDELLLRARKSLAAKDMAGATHWYGQVLASEENPEALLHFSHVEAGAGNYRRGREYALRALAVGASSPALAPSLLLSLRHFNESGALREYIDTSAFLRQLTDPRTLQMLSAQLSWLGDQDSGVEIISRAMQFAPRNAHLHLSRAQMNVFRGNFDAAESDLQECLKVLPNMAGAWWTLANLRKQTSESNHVDSLRRLLASPGTPLVERSYLNYALHKELDDLGDIPGAFAALEAAMKTRRAELKYDKEIVRRQFARLKKLALASQIREVAADFTPVFIVGMFRSGTTLLEQLIGGDPGVINAGELNDMASCLRNAVDHHFQGVVDDVLLDRAGGMDFDALGKQYVDGVRWRVPGSHTHITDKWPPNHVNVGFICTAMPQAKVIHMSRDPVETCFSNMREMFIASAQYSFDQLEMADYYNQYRDLMAHWNARFPDRILNVTYADLTRSTEETMKKVSAFCGLRFTEKMLSPDSEGKSVATASAVQVRNKVVARDVPKWAPYEQYLQPLIGGLNEYREP